MRLARYSAHWGSARAGTRWVLATASTHRVAAAPRGCAGAGCRRLPRRWPPMRRGLRLEGALDHLPGELRLGHETDVVGDGGLPAAFRFRGPVPGQVERAVDGGESMPGGVGEVRPGWYPRCARRSFSSSYAAGPPAAGASTAVPEVTVRTGRTGRRSGPSGPGGTSSATRQALHCDLRPPLHRQSTYLTMIIGGRSRSRAGVPPARSHLRLEC